MNRVEYMKNYFYSRVKEGQTHAAVCQECLSRLRTYEEKREFEQYAASTKK